MAGRRVHTHQSALAAWADACVSAQHERAFLATHPAAAAVAASAPAGTDAHHHALKRSVVSLTTLAFVQKVGLQLADGDPALYMRRVALLARLVQHGGGNRAHVPAAPAGASGHTLSLFRWWCMMVIELCAGPTTSSLPAQERLSAATQALNEGLGIGDLPPLAQTEPMLTCELDAPIVALRLHHAGLRTLPWIEAHGQPPKTKKDAGAGV